MNVAENDKVRETTPCPRCTAIPGFYCNNTSLDPIPNCHEARFLAWKKNEAEVESVSTIEQIMREWQERRGPVMTARTRATNVAPVDTICELYGNYRLDGPPQFTRNMVEEFRNILLKKGMMKGGMSKITVARYLSTLRAGLGDAGEHLKIGKLISELKREPTKVECWTKEEVEKIVNTGRSGTKTAPFWYYINMLFRTGMRRGELLALHWEDFDKERMRIHIHRAMTLDGAVQNGTKWGGERWFPMGQHHLRLYESMGRDCVCPEYGTKGLVFYGLDQRTVGRQFGRVRDAAGVRPFKLHCTRHTAISWALAAGMSLRKASEIFGVSQGTLESHYAHYVEEEVNMDWAEL